MGQDFGDLLELIVESAKSSPSGDNAQPCLFQIENNRILIFHDERRAHHSLNRQNHASCLALGALIEAMKIAGTAYGFEAQFELIFENKKKDLSLWAIVAFFRSHTKRDPLSLVMSERCTDRRLYHGGSVEDAVFRQIRDLGLASKHCQLHIQGRHTIQFINYFTHTESFLWKNQKIVKDLIHWMRLSKSECEQNQDGMSWKNVGLNSVEALFLRLVRSFPVLPKLIWDLGFKFKIRSDAKKSIVSSAGLICFTAKNLDPESLCQAGQLAYRVWLMLNANGYGVQPLSFSSSSIGDLVSGSLSIETSEKERRHFARGLEIFQAHFNLKANEIPVWMFRTGKSSPLLESCRTPRRSFEEICRRKIHVVAPSRQHEKTLN